MDFRPFGTQGGQPRGQRPGGAQGRPMRLPGTGPTREEHAALLREIGPVPIQGMAWPGWVKILAWVVLILIAAQLFRMATGPMAQHVSHVVAACLIIGFLALVVVGRFMMVSETRITETGIEQSWFTRRKVAWDDRSEEHTSELQSLMRISYAVFCLKKKKK